MFFCVKFPLKNAKIQDPSNKKTGRRRRQIHPGGIDWFAFEGQWVFKGETGRKLCLNDLNGFYATNEPGGIIDKS